MRTRFTSSFSPSLASPIVPAPIVLLLLIALFALAGCAPAPRGLPRDGLVARAWAGREPPTTARALEVVAFASAQIGKPYCWGGTGPRCFDCSGLAQTAWRRVGAFVPRTSKEISESLPEISIDEVRAGDILWWPGHVGIYAGNGWVVDALDSRHGVVRRPAIDPYRAFRPMG
jgi:cell wall-associated NlpC family hydrolase